MTSPSVSVIVVSRGRAADLPLCLLGISQLDYPNFEVVLVADRDGLEAAQSLPFFNDLKTVEFNEANISSARNLGIAQAAGEIVAFIDDDAVPEPTWLRQLIEGFFAPDIVAVGGFVIGRNGISFQWQARSVDCTATTIDLNVDSEEISVPSVDVGQAVKTEGTNMAFRRNVIAMIGGFDPAYRFFLDETDVNFRLMKAGHRTAIAPLAQVHHGYKASATRRRDRVPTDLFEIGASLVVYLRKHAPNSLHRDAINNMRDEQRKRALRHMVSGLIEPRDVEPLLKTFENGVDAGWQRELSKLGEVPSPAQRFRAMAERYSGTHEVFSGNRLLRKSLEKSAADAVQSGKRASVFVFSLNARAHSVRFTHRGNWLQAGGIFGWSTRSGRRVFWTTQRKRLRQEVKRLAKVRGFPPEGMND